MDVAFAAVGTEGYVHAGGAQDAFGQGQQCPVLEVAWRGEQPFNLGTVQYPGPRATASTPRDRELVIRLLEHLRVKELVANPRNRICNNTASRNADMTDSFCFSSCRINSDTSGASLSQGK